MRGKSVIVPGLSGFLQQAHDSISSHDGAAVMSGPQPINGKTIRLGFYAVRNGVNTGRTRDVIRFVPVFQSCNDSGNS